MNQEGKESMICGECRYSQDRPFISEFNCDNCGYQNFYDEEEDKFVAPSPSMAYFWPKAWGMAYENGFNKARRLFLVKMV